MSHEGCSGTAGDGKATVDKIRKMGFASQPLVMPFQIECECGETFQMTNHEGKCPKCNMIYGVTPCHAFDIANVKKAGIDY